VELEWPRFCSGTKKECATTL